jgi:2-oxoisovalerate dehydrogenase E1 component
MSGGVGAQYTPTAGWAQAISYYTKVLGSDAHRGALAVVLGGDGSVATNGFWAALTIATTQKLPMLFYIEDNEFGISVPPTIRRRAATSRAISPASATSRALRRRHRAGRSRAAAEAGDRHVRSRQGPCLLRLTVPRLQGHSFQDTQTYKSETWSPPNGSRDPAAEAQILPCRRSHGRGEWERDRDARPPTVERARERRSARPTATRKRSCATSSTKARCSDRRAVDARLSRAARHRGAEAGGPAHQHGHRDPPHARS